MASVQIVLSSAQMRLQKGLIPRPEQNDNISDIGTGLGLGSDFRPIAISTLLNSVGLGSVFIIQPVYHKNMLKNGLNNRDGDICESGIRACPESVGVGKFCRLRLRLRQNNRLRPTPTPAPTPTPTPQP